MIAVDDPAPAFINCLRLAELEAEVSGRNKPGGACGARAGGSSVDCRDGVSTSIGDGAGAAVVGSQPSEQLGLEIVGPPSTSTLSCTERCG